MLAEHLRKLALFAPDVQDPVLAFPTRAALELEFAVLADVFRMLALLAPGLLVFVLAHQVGPAHGAPEGNDVVCLAPLGNLLLCEYLGIALSAPVPDPVVRAQPAGPALGAHGDVKAAGTVGITVLA